MKSGLNLNALMPNWSYANLGFCSLTLTFFCIILEAILGEHMTSAIIVLILSITPIFFPHKFLDKNNSPEVSQKQLKKLRKGGIIAFCWGSV
jgi:peptidoglycan/LPS O-acetylase OafA/YrhL